MIRSAYLCLAVASTGCASGSWTATIWGEDYVEVGIPASEFSDGCSATFADFSVTVTEAALLDGDGEVAGSAAAGSWTLTQPGPQEMDEVEVPGGQYTSARFVIGPSAGPAVQVAGTLTCPDATVTFDWSFDASTTYTCDLADLTVSSGKAASTELTVHGDHLFYDDLEDPDAVLVGGPIVSADADGDGVVTQAELSQVDIAPLGLGVGSHGDVTDLEAFVDQLVRTLGHVDGEGHCAVSG